MRHVRTMFVGIALILFVTPTIADACAALFSPESQVRQSAQRIIFAVDKPNGLVEAYVSVQYVGAAEDFAWIVPLPSNPQVDVAESESFDTLELATNPRFIFPDDTCPDFSLLDRGLQSGAGAPGSGVDVLQQGQVGPYDFSVVGGSSGVALTAWLRENGYRVTQPMEPLIASYTDAGMLFLAMKLQGGQEAGDITPVKLTFAAEKAMIPLRLAAVGAEPDTELLVWVFADSQVVPENMQRITIPADQIVVTGRSRQNNYADLVSSALEQAAGRGLVTEVSVPAAELGEIQDTLITDLRSRFPYVTRLYGRFDPEQMSLDPVFATEGGLPDIPVSHDFSGRINPYDCSSGRTISPSDQLARPGSPQALWIINRWLLPWVLGILVVLGGVIAAVRWRGARR
jgi:Uncharacterized protein conserved in bacteria (DUF2330)